MRCFIITLLKGKYTQKRFEKILTVIVIIIQKNARRRRGENGGVFTFIIDCFIMT